MYYHGPHYRLPGGSLPARDPIDQPAFGQVAYDERLSEDRTLPQRQIAVPAAGAIPSFDKVFSLAVTSVLFDHVVLVICMTEEVLTDWQQRLQERGRPVEGLTLIDGRYGWSTDWRAFFRAWRYDLIVLHGIHRALEDQDLPPSYVKRLTDAVPSGLIVLA